jgi:hypothetical protein
MHLIFAIPQGFSFHLHIMARLIAVLFIIDYTPLRKIHTLQHQEFGATRQIKGDQSAKEMSLRRKHEIAPEIV